MNPVCCICDKPCENTFGNNPLPLTTSDKNGRCCDKCNTKIVIPARQGILECEELDEVEKEKILDECRKEVYNEWGGLLVEIYGGVVPEYIFMDFPAIKKDPVLAEIVKKANDWVREYRKLEKKVNEDCMKYLAKRLECHIKRGSLFRTKDIYLTLSGYMRIICLVELTDLISRQILIQKSWDEALKPIQEKAENELLAGGGAVSQPKEKVKTKAQEKKEQVKKQNKTNEEERKIKEKQEREQAIAYEKRMEQKKQKQREIEMKKRKALLANIGK